MTFKAHCAVKNNKTKVNANDNTFEMAVAA